MENGLISIIIPAFNVELYIERCLDSVINQSYQNIEIILINDGSTDNTFSLCEKYTKLDSRITLINQKNKGPSACRNLGIKLSKGEFIGFIDSDDWIDADMYAYLFEILKTTKSNIACVEHVIIKEKNVNKITEIINEEIKEYFDDDIIYNYLLFEDYSFANKLYRHNLFYENEDIFENNRIYEDIVSNFIIMSRAKKIVKSNLKKYNYFYKIGSISNNKLREKDKDLLYSAKKVIELSERDYSAEIIRLAHLKLEKSYFSLLAKSIYFGIDDNFKCSKDFISFLKSNLRKNAKSLIFSNIKLNRKIAIVLIILFYTPMKIVFTIKRKW